MKLVVRIFALSLVIAGAAAASVSSSSTSSHSFRSHQSATETLPVPTCGPRMPGCQANGQ